MTFSRRLPGLTLIAMAGVAAFFVLNHPRMRLMPPPHPFEDTGPEIVERTAALDDGGRIDISRAAGRPPVGPRDNRTHTIAPSFRLHVARARQASAQRRPGVHIAGHRRRAGQNGQSCIYMLALRFDGLSGCGTGHHRDFMRRTVGTPQRTR